MKKLFGLLVVVGLCGCHSVSYKTEKEHFHATSLFQALKVEKIQRDANGAIDVQGYGRNGDADMMKAVAEGVAKGVAP